MSVNAVSTSAPCGGIGGRRPHGGSTRTVPDVADVCRADAANVGNNTTQVAGNLKPTNVSTPAAVTPAVATPSGETARVFGSAGRLVQPVPPSN